MRIKEEWIYFLIDRGFSAAGARAALEGLREAKQDFKDEEFEKWLKTLKTEDVPKILADYYFGRDSKK
ncbi:hypothetical protein HYT45_01220 [Candidatus Uhrbacteria bacterium]|nr:hypothetical protein [Candidatus Uhrbacteria bacterium]